MSVRLIDGVLIGADWVLTFALLKGTLFALVAFAAGALLTRATPTTRAALWAGSLAALVLAPVAALLAPRWTAPLIAFPQRLWRTAPGEVVSVAALDALPIAAWAFGIWAAGATVAVVRVLLDVRAAMRIARAARPVRDARTLALLAQARTALGITRSIRLGTSEAVAGPVSLGWRRATILLPPAHTQWPADRLTAVLLHESAHVRRRDWPIMITCALVRALHWINPLIGRLCTQLRVAQDRACDALAIRRGGLPAAEYARHLVDVARTLRNRPPVAAALPLLGTDDLQRRVREVLEPARAPSTIGMAFAIAFVAAFAIGVGSADLWRCDASAAATVSTTTTF